MPTSKSRSASAEEERGSVEVEGFRKEVYVGVECKTEADSSSENVLPYSHRLARDMRRGGEEMRDIQQGCASIELPPKHALAHAAMRGGGGKKQRRPPCVSKNNTESLLERL
jgi:hypothetical protein